MLFNRNKSIISVLLVLVIIIVGSGMVLSASNLMVDPARIEVPLSPGQPISGAIRLLNPGSEALRLGAEIRDWNLTENGEPLFDAPNNKKASCSEWIRFNPRIFQLDPGKSQIVRYTINVPKGTPSGEYRCAIVFAVEPAKPDNVHIDIIGNVMTTVYAEVQPVRRSGEIVNSTANYHRETGLTVQTTIKSTGNAHLRLAGSFKLIGVDGKVVGEGLYSGKVVFPGTKRGFVGEWKGQLSKGKYAVQSKFRFLPSLYAVNMGEYGTVQDLNAETILNVE